ncbi:hypothetical protein E2C01_069241 [Portunus trituberculatus]|uniref:Uncharacterized protein n=1 Tax=Portunus trituberculatus TaxID=210409 RepID=A0A5B7HY12_PORTR|nr:hypothetical protein [Portunus trituberculatus]
MVMVVVGKEKSNGRQEGVEHQERKKGRKRVWVRKGRVCKVGVEGDSQRECGKEEEEREALGREW